MYGYSETIYKYTEIFLILVSSIFEISNLRVGIGT